MLKVKHDINIPSYSSMSGKPIVKITKTLKTRNSKNSIFFKLVLPWTLSKSDGLEKILDIYGEGGERNGEGTGEGGRKKKRKSGKEQRRR
jgi:hypothetical protein